MNEVISFVQDHADYLLMGAAVLILVLVIGFGLHKAKKVPGEEHMKKEDARLSARQQRRAENNMVADVVGDGLLLLLAENKLSPERYDAWSLRLGKRAGLPDLLKPRPKKPQTIAQRKKVCAMRIEELKKAKVVPTPVVKPKPNIVASLLNGTT